MGGAGRFCRRGGNPPAPAFPLGETGKGDPHPCCRRLFPRLLPLRAVVTTAASPCFHSHSRWSFRPGAVWCPSSDRCCHLSTELIRFRCRQRPFRRDSAVTRTRRFVTTSIRQVCSGSSSCSALCCPGIPQRLVDFACHPQPVQQHRQLPRHGHHRPFLRVLPAAACQLQSPPPQIRIRPR